MDQQALNVAVERCASSSRPRPAIHQTKGGACHLRQIAQQHLRRDQERRLSETHEASRQVVGLKQK